MRLRRPAGGGAEADLARWMAAQAQRAHAAVRLEDALLADRFAAYFWYRLRLFLMRTALVALLHAIRIVLLYGAFSRSQFVGIVLVGALTAIAADFWWGALEVMRGRIRDLHRDSAVHRIPGEIGGWLRLASRGTIVGLGGAGAWAFLRLAVGDLGPADAYAVAMIAGASLGLIVRAYHSGAYALRRVYRPFASLLLADSVGVASLVLLWPLLGIWAFPVSEVIAVCVVVAVTVRYTAATYRVLGFPTLATLLRTPRPMPGRERLRSAVSPGVAYALVGLESLVIVAVLTSPGADGRGSLLALLAALGPVIRAGFEWAQLLYFDLVRLEVPLLRGLRRRFDAAIVRLAVVMGLAAWSLAALVGALVMGIRDGALLLAMLPFLMGRSLLASAQMRTFTAGAYRRLAIVGTLGGIGSLLVLGLVETETVGSPP